MSTALLAGVFEVLAHNCLLSRCFPLCRSIARAWCRLGAVGPGLSFLAWNGGAGGGAPGAVFAFGVDPAQGPPGGFAGVGAGELHEVGGAAVHGLQVHGLGAGGRGGADEEPEFARGDPGGFGAGGGGGFVAEFEGVSQAFRGVNFGDRAGGGDAGGGAGRVGHGDLHGLPLGVGDGGVFLHLADGGADQRDVGGPGVVLGLAVAEGLGLRGLMRGVGGGPVGLPGGQGGQIAGGDAEGGAMGGDVGEQGGLPVVKDRIGGGTVIGHGLTPFN